MREFFKGWRRKVGCVALVTVWALTASMWIRSFTVRQMLLSFDVGNRRITVFSHNGGLTTWEVRLVDWLDDRDMVTAHILTADPVHQYWFIGLLLSIPATTLILWEPLTKEIHLCRTPQMKRDDSPPQS